jgi:O-antigen/teichoic acid export membrane protein
MQKIQEYTVFGRQIVYVISGDIVTVVLGIIQIPIVTRALGSSQYGIWALIITAVSLITPFTGLSFSMSLIRFLAAEKDTDRIREDFLSAFTLVMLVGVIFSVLFFSFSGFFAKYILKDASLSIYFRLSSVLILLNSTLPVALAFFRRGSRIGMFNLLNLSWNVFQVGLTILFISLGYGLKGVIGAAILSAAALNVMGLYIILKEIGFRRPKFSNMKPYLKWGLPLTPNSAIQWIINASDRYIVNYFKGVSAAGIYNAADSLGGYASFALMPIGIVLFPIVSKTYDEGKTDECRDYLKYSFKYLMMLVIPSAVGLSMFAKRILLKLTTPQFISGSSVVALATLGALWLAVFQILIYVIQIVGKTHITIRLLSISAVLNIILNIILIPRMGIIGAELASVIAYVVLGALALIVTRNYLKFDLSLSFLIKSALSSGFMALCIWLINPQSVLMLLVSIIAGIFVYFTALILIRGFSKSELAFFNAFMRNSFKVILGRKIN